MSPLVAALLVMLGSKDPAHAGSAYVQLAERAAPQIQAAVAAEGGDEMVLAAVLVRESGLRSHVIGAAGELGMGQLHPRGMARIVCAGLDWRKADNVRCAARLLVWAEARCPGPPLRWCGAYNGKVACGPGRYARRVLALVARVRRYQGIAIAGLTLWPPSVR